MHTAPTAIPPATPEADLSTPTSKDLLMRHAPVIHRLTGARPRRLSRLAGTLVALASLSVAGLGLSAAPALAEDCPNAALRAENNSTRLPECRAYEMVTPLYKEGFPVEAQGLSADGGAFAYTSSGIFADNPNGQAFNQYVAERGAAGWTTTAHTPPADRYGVIVGFGADALSADFRRSLWKAIAPSDADLNYYIREPDGSFTRIGQGSVPGTSPGNPYTIATSPDLSHVVFAHDTGGGYLPFSWLWEFIGTGNTGPPRRVSVTNDGQFVPTEPCFAGMSTDARVIAFGCVGGGQLWARVGGSVTIALSSSECTRTSGDPAGACNAPANVHFVGMAKDGSRVYFTTTQQLVNGDTDQTNDLYECDIPPGAPAPVGAANPCPSLTEVTGGVTGADVENVVNVSEDGSRVYFLARGVLAANLGTNDAAPVAGDHNLYVWEEDAAHPAGQTTFVAKLESSNIFRPQITADGRYLVFGTTDRLLASDTDEATDVYRYDANTGALLRLSTATDGSGGNEPGAEAIIKGRPMTDDASAVVFETAEALSPADTDGVTDVYEWHEGLLSLISSGGGEAIGISGSGQDIFFVTRQPLTPGDSGTEGDVYDARVGGGFDVSAQEPCAGEACQGGLTVQPQPPGVSASAAFNGPGSPPAAESPPANPKPKAQTTARKLAKALKACRSKHNKKKRTACEKKARNIYRRGK